MSELRSWNRSLEDGIMEKLKSNSKTFEVTEKDVQVDVQGKVLQIFSRESSALSPKGNILFLHGQRFTSKNWQDINSLGLMAAMGYRAVAVDLPGYGQSKDMSVDSGDIALFMDNLISSLGLTTPVIVSPSMSGMFSLPYLMKEPQNVATRAKGFVPVAPINTEKYPTDQYKLLQLPTAAVYGANDATPMVGQSQLYFKHLPDHEFITMPDAGHPAYLEKPDMFHSIMYNFLSDIYTTK